MTEVRLFGFRLCLALGVQHPDHLQLTWRQFNDWITYCRHEPFGDERADLRAGIVTAAIRGGRATDHMPYYRPPQQTAEEQMKIMASFLGK